MKITLYKARGLNIPVMHHQSEVDTLVSFLQRNEIDLIINIGSWFAGVESVFHATTDAEIYGFDKEQGTKKAIRTLFWSDHTALIEQDVLCGPSKLIKRLMNTEDRIFLYCDGGNKIKEIEFYAPMLKPGDFLGTHDWVLKKEETLKNILKWFKLEEEERSVRIWRRY